MTRIGFVEGDRVLINLGGPLGSPTVEGPNIRTGTFLRRGRDASGGIYIEVLLDGGDRERVHPVRVSHIGRGCICQPGRLCCLCDRPQYNHADPCDCECPVHDVGVAESTANMGQLNAILNALHTAARRPPPPSGVARTPVIDEVSQALGVTTYTYKMTWGETLRIRADLVQASAPIQVANDDDEDGGWTSIPYQTADARHRQSDMLSLVIRYLGHEWYGACGRGECGCLARAIEGAEEVQS